MWIRIHRSWEKLSQSVSPGQFIIAIPAQGQWRLEGSLRAHPPARWAELASSRLRRAPISREMDACIVRTLSFKLRGMYTLINAAKHLADGQTRLDLFPFSLLGKVFRDTLIEGISRKLPCAGCPALPGPYPTEDIFAGFLLCDHRDRHQPPWGSAGMQNMEPLCLLHDMHCVLISTLASQGMPSLYAVFTLIL